MYSVYIFRLVIHLNVDKFQLSLARRPLVQKQTTCHYVRVSSEGQVENLCKSRNVCTFTYIFHSNGQVAHVCNPLQWTVFTRVHIYISHLMATFHLCSRVAHVHISEGPLSQVATFHVFEISYFVCQFVFKLHCQIPDRCAFSIVSCSSKIYQSTTKHLCVSPQITCEIPDRAAYYLSIIW